MKVLLVEDDVDLLDLTTYALRREGYEVVAAVDGTQGLARWEAERPDLVLLDGNLPGLNGFEVCRRIRQAGATPIVMLTARDREEDNVRGLQLGADVRMDGARSMSRGSPDMGNRNATAALPRLTRPGVTVSGA